MLLPMCKRVMVLGGAALVFTLSAGAAEDPVPDGKAQYHKLHPAFVVNLASDGRKRFMQTETQVMARSGATIEAVKYHQPAIRHALILLFSGQESTELQTMEGKERLRSEALKAINDVLKRETGEGNVAGVYFTSLVIQ